MSKRKQPGNKSKPVDKIVAQIIPVSGDLVEGAEQHRKLFIEKFGREPGLDDPLIFDPDLDTPTAFEPEKLTAQTAITMFQAGAPEEFVYAYLRTGGTLLTEDNEKTWPEENREAWTAAIKEYQDTFVHLRASTGEPETHRTGRFVPCGGTPYFVLDQEQASEYLITDGWVFHAVLNKLVANKSWLMLLPPTEDDDSWVLFVQLSDVELVEGVLDSSDAPILKACFSDDFKP